MIDREADVERLGNLFLYISLYIGEDVEYLVALCLHVYIYIERETDVEYIRSLALHTEVG